MFSKRLFVLTTALGIFAGCSNKAGTGAAIGAAGGAVLGGLIGSKDANFGKGAAIGAAAGALGGAAIGHNEDKKDERERRDSETRDRAQTAASTPVTRADVIQWSQSTVSDDVIIDRIERSGSRFQLTDADVRQLRQARVSERVINAMKATATASAN